VHKHWLTRALAGTALGFVCAAIACPARAADQVEQHLRDQYLSKTFLLRGFYSGNSLHFDSAGTLREDPTPGDWTVDGAVQVNEISISRSRLLIRASREHLGWIQGSGPTDLHDQLGKGKPDKDEKKSRTLQIEADLGPGGITAEVADAALQRIFLNSNDHFADLVPDYWKPCIRAALGIGNDANMHGCRLSPDFLAIPGVAHASDSPVRTEPETAPKIQQLGTRPPPTPPVDENGVYRVGHGVSPPRVLSQSDPEFTEEARKVKFQGTVVIWTVVDKNGIPTHIRISNPIGCGLDAKAVQAVQTWRFRPGEKDGEPVAVAIAVEVDFHLY